MTDCAVQRWKQVARCVTAITFAAAGANHFRSTDFYARIVPPLLPYPRTLVFVSGWAELAGGLAILVKPLRRFAGWGLIALLIAVFPANVHMAQHPEAAPELRLPAWVLWARLPLQLPLIALVWFAAFDEPRQATLQAGV